MFSNQDLRQVNPLFIIQTQGQFGDHQGLPPGEPKTLAKLRTCKSYCVNLKLEYNQNMEGAQIIFQCDNPLDFGESSTAAWPDSRLIQPVKVLPFL